MSPQFGEMCLDPPASSDRDALALIGGDTGDRGVVRTRKGNIIAKGERVIDVQEIDPRVRHTAIFQLFEYINEVSSLQLIADQDARLLRLQLEAKHGNRCYWTYLKRGPDIWRIRLRCGHRGGRP